MKRYLAKTAEILGFMLGSGINALILLSCVYAIYYFTIKGFEVGLGFSKESGDNTPYNQITIELKEDTTVADAAKLLADNGLVKNAYLYQFENYLKGSRDAYAQGIYTLDTDMSSSDLNRALRAVAAVSTEKKITIPEGRNIKEIAKYLEEEGLVTAEDFLRECNEGDFRYDFLEDIPKDRENRLEGYLFPDTYFVSERPSPAEIIDKMLFRFSQMYDWECELTAKELGLSTDDCLIIASIIEKEIAYPPERVLASSVIYNRLEKDMRLEMCSTVIYVLEKAKSRLLDEDLQIESPYNTYLNKGLPIGPIACPGKACIEAALAPAETNYLFFVVKDDTTGEHVFTHDYDEFLSAKVLYNQRF